MISVSSLTLGCASAMLCACLSATPVTSQEANLDPESSFLNLVKLSPFSGEEAGCDSTASSPVGLAAGSDHTLVWFQSKGAQGWGSNYWNQLGVALDQKGLNKTPQWVHQLDSKRVLGMVGGEGHSCAWFETGATCWGDNNNSQLGGAWKKQANGVIGLENKSILGMTAGRSHTCAWFKAEEDAVDAVCWGRNSFGQLGRGHSNTDYGDISNWVVRLPNKLILGMTAGASHTCAWFQDGGAMCWGANNHGQLGRRTVNNNDTVDDTVDDFGLTPQLVVGLGDKRILGMTAGKFHTCAWFQDGGAMCWGGNEYGQLGRGNKHPEKKIIPGEVLDLGSKEIRGMTSGLFHTCAWFDKGAMCWGYNKYWQLGRGHQAEQDNGTPQPVVGLPSEEIVQMAAGVNHTCALLPERGVSCWGDNENHRLGFAKNISVVDSWQRWSPNDTSEASENCYYTTTKNLTKLSLTDQCSATHRITCKRNEVWDLLRIQASVSAYPEGDSTNSRWLSGFVRAESTVFTCENTSTCEVSSSVSGPEMMHIEECKSSTTGYVMNSNDNRLYRVKKVIEDFTREDFVR